MKKREKQREGNLGEEPQISLWDSSLIKVEILISSLGNPWLGAMPKIDPPG